MQYVEVIGACELGQYMPLVLLELSDAWGDENGGPLLSKDDERILQKFAESQVWRPPTALEKVDMSTVIPADELPGYAWEILEECIDYARAEFAGGNWRLHLTENGDLLAYNITAVEYLGRYAVRACPDCRDFLCGIDSGELPESREQEVADACQRTAESIDALPEGSAAPEELAQFSDALEDDEFSIADCDCCGSHLAGPRYALVLVPDHSINDNASAE